MTRSLDRRDFLATAGATAASFALPSNARAADAKPLTIVDTHTHFYDRSPAEARVTSPVRSRR